MSPPDRKSIVVMVGGEQEQIRAAPGRHQVRRDEREMRGKEETGAERGGWSGETREERGVRAERVLCSLAVVVYEMY